MNTSTLLASNIIDLVRLMIHALSSNDLSEENRKWILTNSSKLLHISRNLLNSSDNKDNLRMIWEIYQRDRERFNSLFTEQYKIKS